MVVVDSLVGFGVGWPGAGQVGFEPGVEGRVAGEVDQALAQVGAETEGIRTDIGMLVGDGGLDAFSGGHGVLGRMSVGREIDGGCRSAPSRGSRTT